MPGKRPADDEEELQPTDEQKRAYAQMSQAAIALSRMDKFLAQLPVSQIAAHTTQPNCIAVPALGNSMALVEIGREIGIAVPPALANWIEDFPFDFIAATSEELFFVSKGFTWLGSAVPPLGISLGPLIPTDMLAAMCAQETTSFYMVKKEELANPQTGVRLRDRQPVRMFKVPDGGEVLHTRKHAETMSKSKSIDAQSQLAEHFLG